MKTSTPIYILKRQAKRLSRSTGLSWLAALDRVAQGEGYGSWGLLRAKYEEHLALRPARILGELGDGELLLIASRPGFGKTLLSLELLLDGARRGRACYFFSLDYTHHNVRERLEGLGATAAQLDALRIDCSNDISSAYIREEVQQGVGGQVGALIVVDYLQLLDQKRSHPPLQQQIQELRVFARETKSNIVFLSQVERDFEGLEEVCPSLEHIRLPNPLDLSLFHKGVFLHEDKHSFEAFGESR